jgi:hypothetical protein
MRSIYPDLRNRFAAALRTLLLPLVLTLAVTFGAARTAHAQAHWTGIGSISGTAMFMDTTTIQRDAAIRRVWLRSLDLTPRMAVAGTDTVVFDTVISLNIFDCAHATRTVAAVRYALGDSTVHDIPDIRATPEPVRPTSFYGQVYKDLCQSRP